MAVGARALALLREGRALPAALTAALSEVGQSRSAGGALATGSGGSAGSLPGASQSAVRALTYDAVRQLGAVDALSSTLNRRAAPPPLAALQGLALAQLLRKGRADAVVVDQAVAAARLLMAGPAADSAAGFINATLRRFLRERTRLIEALRSNPVARWNHPRWWIDRLQRAWPDDWRSILEIGNQQPPMSLRVNQRRSTVTDYLARLAEAGIGARQIGEQAIVVDTPRPVGDLPGWSEGRVSVQDAGAQLAASLLAPRDGERVLDACAAPGGKTTHLLEIADCELTALDIETERLAPIRENLARLGQTATVRAADASQPDDWWDGRAFQRILVDAPCTASGIVRRHPDIRWLRRPADVCALAQRQHALLVALWPLLERGGRLLYATCSVFPEENDAVVERFLDARADARRLMPQVRIGQRESVPAGQLLPVASAGRDHDGFFYALLEKRR